MSPIKKLRHLIETRFENNQAAFARAIKRSPSQVNQWLSGYRKLDVKAAKHIEQQVGLAADYLLDGDKIVTTMYSTNEPVLTKTKASSYSPEVAEIVDIASHLDKIGIGMLLREARFIQRERLSNKQREAM